MKLFTCSSCRQVVFFENVRCTQCGHMLAYLPELGVVDTLEPAPVKPPPPEPGRTTRPAPEPTEGASPPLEYTSLAPAARGRRYRLCRNAVDHGACNWAVAVGDSSPYCHACRLNRVVPDLSSPAAKAGWIRLEQAKRRLIYTLDALGLTVDARPDDDFPALEFAFLEAKPGGEPVLTGHADGLITVNIAEADDAHREKARNELAEPYRTVLGHFRHESAHYYWDRLVRGTPWLEPFRAQFGDERLDYDSARQRHYELGAPGGWAENYISAYATMHPWEDWAETWAHYLHMVDTLETARSFGLALRPKPVGGAAPETLTVRRLEFEGFEDLLNAWVPLTLALNSLNRSMGTNDPYPFALSARAARKLEFVHQVIERTSASLPAPGSLDTVPDRSSGGANATQFAAAPQ